jgi:hypothetical protein
MFSSNSGNVGNNAGSLIPKGTLAECKFVIRDTKNSQSTGGMYLDVELVIQSGDFANRRVFTKIADPFDQRNSEKWREMGQSALARIAESAGVFQVGNDESYAQFNSDENVLRMAEALQGATVRIKVGVEKGTDGHGDKNSVADWGSPNPDSNGHRTWSAFDAAPAAPKSAFAPKAAAAAPAKASGTKPAWIK